MFVSTLLPYKHLSESGVKCCHFSPLLSGPLFQGELQVPAPSSPSKDPTGDQWQEQSDPAEEYGHARPTDAARQCHDAWHAATTYGERTHTYEHTTATAHGEITYM